MNKRRTGFTLVELLVVTVILAVISLAIYSALRNGLSIWARVSQTDAAEDVNIFLYRFTMDMSNAFVYQNSSVRGMQEECSSWGIVRSEFSGYKTVGSIEYRYDPGEGKLLRLERDYSGIFEGAAGAPTAELTGVAQARFLYYAWDEQAREYAWLDQWQIGQLPVAVRLDFSIEYEKKNVHYTRSVFLPLAR